MIGEGKRKATNQVLTTGGGPTRDSVDNMHRCLFSHKSKKLRFMRKEAGHLSEGVN